MRVAFLPDVFLDYIIMSGSVNSDSPHNSVLSIIIGGTQGEGVTKLLVHFRRQALIASKLL